MAVKPRKRLSLADLTLLALLACTAGAAGAQAIQDPTRPPAGLMPARGPSAGGLAVQAPARVPRLQSVLIARQPGGRHVAVIDGQTVRLGDAIGGARVVRIAQNEVELRRGRARQVLKLNAPAAPAPGGIERLRQE